MGGGRDEVDGDEVVVRVDVREVRPARAPRGRGLGAEAVVDDLERVLGLSRLLPQEEHVVQHEGLSRHHGQPQDERGRVVGGAGHAQPQADRRRDAREEEEPQQREAVARREATASIVKKLNLTFTMSERLKSGQALKKFIRNKHITGYKLFASLSTIS